MAPWCISQSKRPRLVAGEATSSSAPHFPAPGLSAPSIAQRRQLRRECRWASGKSDRTSQRATPQVASCLRIGGVMSASPVGLEVPTCSTIVGAAPFFSAGRSTAAVTPDMNCRDSHASSAGRMLRVARVCPENGFWLVRRNLLALSSQQLRSFGGCGRARRGDRGARTGIRAGGQGSRRSSGGFRGCRAPGRPA